MSTNHQTSDAERFWRENVRPGTEFGKHTCAPTLWHRVYDWLFGPST